MNKVEQYLQKCDKLISEDREKTLISLGLTEKEYSPDFKESREYNKCDYVNGEKRYYKDVAISVSDEEYELITRKAKEVEAIRDREAQKSAFVSKTSVVVKKNLSPVFKLKKYDNPTNDPESEDDGTSGVAYILRIVAWILMIFTAITGLVALFEDGLTGIVVIGAGLMEMLILYALAAALDYLAEIAATLRNGFKFTDTKK